jgi:hypothetical protein
MRGENEEKYTKRNEEENEERKITLTEMRRRKVWIRNEGGNEESKIKGQNEARKLMKRNEGK